MAQENRDSLLSALKISVQSDGTLSIIGQRGFDADSLVRLSAGRYRISIDPRYTMTFDTVVPLTHFAADPPDRFLHVVFVTFTTSTLELQVFDSAGSLVDTTATISLALHRLAAV